MTRPHRTPDRPPVFGIGPHHAVGAGLLAGLFGIYQFASQDTSSRIPTESRTTVPSGLPVSYDGSSNPYEFQPPSSESDLQNRYARQSPGNVQSDIRVFFSPMGGCTDAIVSELQRAQRQVLIQAYSFTSEPIAAACIAAHNRGVAVYAVLDKSQETEQYSAADLLINSGITTLIDSQHAIAHNKVILIDGLTVITGSFNFTSNAERSNAENLLIIRNHPDLFSAYESNLRHHFDHSKQYVSRAARTTSKQTGRSH